MKKILRTLEKVDKWLGFAKDASTSMIDVFKRFVQKENYEDTEIIIHEKVGEHE